MNLTIRYCILITILLSGCNKSQTESIDDYTGSAIWPLAVGNSWTYEVLGSEGGTYTISIAGTMKRNGNIWYYLNENNPEAAMFRNDEDGMWNLVKGEEILLWKYPAQNGEIYNEEWEGDNMTSFSICARTDITYMQYDNCYFYKFFYGQNNSTYNSYYFKPEIGLIGQAYFENEVVVYMDKLISYNLE